MHYTFLNNLLDQWKFVVLTIAFFTVLSFTVSAVLPAKYQSDISLIVIQKQSSEKVDAFSATKSAEFLSSILSRVIYTYSFFKEVQEAPFAARDDFSFDPEERIEQWKKVVLVSKVNNTGIIHVSVLDSNRMQAEETAKAIAWTYVNKSGDYHGGGDRVEVKVIDGPNTPLQPTVPNVLQNTLFGLIVGIVIAFGIVYFFPKGIKKGRKYKSISGQTVIHSTPTFDIDKEEKL